MVNFSMDWVTVKSLLGSNFSRHINGVRTTYLCGSKLTVTEPLGSCASPPAHSSHEGRVLATLPVRGSLLHAYTKGKIIGGPGSRGALRLYPVSWGWGNVSF